ncbi:hypothetical protein BJY01DRAFT_240617 [Aspergillus pseudoustus]|uniref:NAD(P)-binding protein n=1 Tax=Aspergillus pseudoustus TaxID=1810923 RepID=A0ABR4IPV1_9EURO
MGSSHPTKISFHPSSDIPSLKDKVILVTGGNSGLGKQSLIELCQHEPSTIWLASRRIDKANEIRFGTNYLGHAFPVHCLLPLLVETARQSGSDMRVVLLSSVAHRYAPSKGIIFSSLKNSASNMGTVARYGQSKLAIILYGQELARKYPMLKAAIVHPGQVRTSLGDTASSSSVVMIILWKLTSAFMGVGPQTGVLNQLWGATAHDIQSGEYYEPVGVMNRGSKHTRGPELAVRLWNWTMQEFHEYKGNGEGAGVQIPEH